MATKQAIQIREVTARQQIERSLAQLAEALDITPVTPVREYSPDPAYRWMLELEATAATLTRIAEAVEARTLGQSADAPVHVDTQTPDYDDYESLTVSELLDLAEGLGIDVPGKARKAEIIDALRAAAEED